MAVSEKQKPRLDGCGALLEPRGLKPYLGTDTVQPGLGNRVQSIVEMNKEDIERASLMKTCCTTCSEGGEL